MTSINPAILIVDDEDIVRKSCVRILSPEGYTLETAKNAGDALKKLNNKTFDLVLTDLVMPDVTGIDLLKKIKEEWPETEVIIITGYGTVKTAVDALKYGAYDYIEKPFTPDALVNAVGRCLEKKRLLTENIRLKQEIHALYSLDNIIGASKEMQKVFKLMATVASTGSTVLITGESGTGKELVARGIHYNSARREQPFIVVDCGTIPENLMESELFGHTKGSFTGAIATEKGVLEAANGGTVFLDEIGDLSIGLQSKLLRVLEDQEIRPVGGTQSIKVDLRFISATNKDIENAVKGGTFREDLFYRLNVIPIDIPPLRERIEDILPLCDYFIEKHSKRFGRNPIRLTDDAMKMFISYHWPGNVRELEHVIERAVILEYGKKIGISSLPAEVISRPREMLSPKGIVRLEDMERQLIQSALRFFNGRRDSAARALGISTATLWRKLKKYNLD